MMTNTIIQCFDCHSRTPLTKLRLYACHIVSAERCRDGGCATICYVLRSSTLSSACLLLLLCFDWFVPPACRRGADILPHSTTKPRHLPIIVAVYDSACIASSSSTSPRFCTKMNGLDPQGSEGPYFNAPPPQQQQPPPQPSKRKGDEESPGGGGQRVGIFLAVAKLLNIREKPLT